MLCFSHHLQVFQRVVVPIYVNVVHNLLGCEKAPHVLLHHEPMLHDVSLTVRERMMRCETSPVSPVASIRDAALERRVVLSSNVGTLPRPFTFQRTELLGSLPGRRDIRPALPTVVSRCASPSGGSVAVTRTILRGFFTPVFGVKRLVALDAFKRQCFSFHCHIIACEEKYCEIAARRLRQSVLPLEGVA
jgi:hypothetical protein